MDGNVNVEGIEGMVVGNVGSVAGKGGNVTFGIVEGMVGRVGIVGSVGRGVAGKGGNTTFGSVGIAGNGGIETLGKGGIFGRVGAEVCSRWRAPKLISTAESDRAATKIRMKQCLEVPEAAMLDKSRRVKSRFIVGWECSNL
ncbi:hypothetical protein DCAR_0416960 [Daucus carota subsp. sativus]|uniref:Uncharacterized protein n=1 Tax=Daucus carota subsp. sativus TaxID=79200 RepID=A0A165XXM3_DAUCS|nr:hypothetical protein DCAR_0416960 [Daucus carota subsp. sativus]